MFIMCQCLFTTSLVFGNQSLYITEKKNTWARIGLDAFKSDFLLFPADLVVDVGFFVNFLHKPF